MKDLLAAIKTKLQTGLTYIRDRDINIVPHTNYIPNAIKTYGIGIKDGKITRKEQAGGMIEITLEVKLAVYVQLAKDEASIMGDTSTSKKGLLEVSDDIHSSLDENMLSITGMQEAFSPSETESELFGDDRETLQRKIITYRYVKEEERPSIS